MVCPPVRGDNPRALASGLSPIQVDSHGITVSYHMYKCRSYGHTITKVCSIIVFILLVIIRCSQKLSLEGDEVSGQNTRHLIKHDICE